MVTPVKFIPIIRWVARVWSILIFLQVILLLVIPGVNPIQAKTGAPEPGHFSDFIEVSFLGMAVLGLAIAWRLEGLGSIITIIGVLTHHAAFRMILEYWYPGIVLSLFVILPGILFLVCWIYTRRSNQPVAQDKLV